MRLSVSAIVPQVPGKGLEPSCLYRAADFESAAAAISPPGRIADVHSLPERAPLQENPTHPLSSGVIFIGEDGWNLIKNKKGAPVGAPFVKDTK